MCSFRIPVCVSLSPAEAEYVSLLEGCSDVQGMIQFLTELNIEMNNAPNLHADDTAATTWAEKALGTRKVKRINSRCHFVKKDVVANGAVKLVDVNLENNVTDMLAKPLNKLLFSKIRTLLGVKTVPALAQREHWFTVLTRSNRVNKHWLSFYLFWIICWK